MLCYMYSSHVHQYHLHDFNQLLSHVQHVCTFQTEITMLHHDEFVLVILIVCKFYDMHFFNFRQKQLSLFVVYEVRSMVSIYFTSKIYVNS
jgi:hypothetical protein